MCLVCKQGYHGDFCNLQCPASCTGECDKVTGQCGSELCVQGPCTHSTSKNISVGTPETPRGTGIAVIVVPLTVVVVLAIVISVVVVIVRSRCMVPNNGRRTLEQRTSGYYQRAPTRPVSSGRSSCLNTVLQLNSKGVNIQKSADPKSETQPKVPLEEDSVYITSDEDVEHVMQTPKS